MSTFQFDMHKLNSFCVQHSADTTSEEEGEVSEDEARRRNLCRQSISTLSSEGGVFSEEEEEENTSEVSHNMGLMSTNSAENLQMELAKCTYASDGLSDREMTVRKMKSQVSSPPERIYEVCHRQQIILKLKGVTCGLLLLFSVSAAVGIDVHPHVR